MNKFAIAFGTTVGGIVFDAGGAIQSFLSNDVLLGLAALVAFVLGQFAAGSTKISETSLP